MERKPKNACERLPVLLVIGDSISLHYGPYLKQMLDGVFTCTSMHADEQALVGGSGGDSFATLKVLADAADTGLQRAWVLLNCGLHDMKTNPKTGEKQVPLEQYERNLMEIVSRSAHVGRLVWVRITPVDDERHNSAGMEFYRYASDVDAYNAVADRVMNERHLPAVDLYGFTRNLGPDVYCDHVHFTDPARQMQAAYIAGHLAAMRLDDRD